jgi:hypothetical protein
MSLKKKFHVIRHKYKEPLFPPFSLEVVSLVLILRSITYLYWLRVPHV